MKQFFLKNENTKILNLFFAGWGVDWHPFEKNIDTYNDTLICYDYRKPMLFDMTLIKNYEEIRVAAWSLGVMTAQLILPELSKQHYISQSIAINGTTFPIDEECGIAPAIFKGTLDNLNPRNLDKFRRRMCGHHYSEFMINAPQREFDEIKEELDTLYQLALSPHALEWQWTLAIVSSNDLIFMPENQRKAWNKLHVPIVNIDETHFFAEMTNSYLHNKWTKQK